MTRYEKVQLQRDAVRLFSDYGVPEADIVKTFPLPSITVPRSIAVAARNGKVKVSVVSAGVLRVEGENRNHVMRDVADMIHWGFITNPLDVLRVQALLANPTETIEDKS